jgi:hypothetical protein
VDCLIDFVSNEFGCDGWFGGQSVDLLVSWLVSWFLND